MPDDSPKDHIDFTIEWTGDQPAELFYLVDDAQTVVVPSKGPVASHGLTYSYESDQADQHEIGWSLKFGDQTLSGLKATAKVNGGSEQQLDSVDGSQAHHWTSHGMAFSAGNT